MSELESGIYEECPICEGDEWQALVSALGDKSWRAPCAWCGGTGLVPHECPMNEEVAA